MCLVGSNDIQTDTRGKQGTQHVLANTVSMLNHCRIDSDSRRILTLIVNTKFEISPLRTELQVAGEIVEFTIEGNAQFSPRKIENSIICSLSDLDDFLITSRFRLLYLN